MKRMQNFWFVALGLIFLGWATACAGTEDMMAKEDTMTKDDSMAKKDMMDKKMGMEKEIHTMLVGSDGHHAAGKVSFGMGMDKAHRLTLSDIKVDKVPDGYVYLAKDGNWMQGVQVGMLKQFSGTVSFDLPAGVNPDDYDTVVIWCKKFNVEIGRATYGKKM